MLRCRSKIRRATIVPGIFESLVRSRCLGTGGNALRAPTADRSITSERIGARKTNRSSSSRRTGVKAFAGEPRQRPTSASRAVGAKAVAREEIAGKDAGWKSMAERFQDLLNREENSWFDGDAKHFASVATDMSRQARKGFYKHIVRAAAKLVTADLFGPTSLDHFAKRSLFPAWSKFSETDVSQLCVRRCSQIVREMLNSSSLRESDLKISRMFLYTLILQAAEPKDWRKASDLVNGIFEEDFGFEPGPHHRAMAAILCWRAGASSRAARHLDDMGGIEGVLAARYPLHLLPSSKPSTQVDTCRSLLTAMDIYGRAGRWAKVAEAFSALANSKPPADSPVGAANGSASAADSAVAVDLLSAHHSTPLAFAVTAYLKLGHVNVAAAALSIMRATLSSDGAAMGAMRSVVAPRRSPGVTMGTEPGKGQNGGDHEAESRAVEKQTLLDGVGGDNTEEELVYMGRHPDVAWINSTVRAFVRKERWDLAAAVLSPEICEWACIDLVVLGEVGQPSSNCAASEDVRGEREKLRQSLGPFLEKKATVKRLANGTVEGAKACIRALEMAVGTMSTRGPASPFGTAESVVAGAEVSEDAGQDLSFKYPSEAGLDTATGESGKARTRTELVSAEALRWLASSKIQRETSGIAEEASNTTSSEQLDLLNSLPPSLPADFTKTINSPDRVADELLRSRAACLPTEVILTAVRRAWASDLCRADEEVHDVGKWAALALYEAGVGAGKLSVGVQWASAAAGVVDLSGGNFSKNQAVGICALHVALKDMLWQYAYEEEIGRHVHNPCTDLIVIVDVTVSSSAVSSARNILWLLSSAFSRFENGALNPPELVGLGARNMKKMASKPLLKMKQITERPHSTGVVLCLPRLQLQRWLLAEGRAWRGDRGKLWSPPWLEFEVDAPPLLPVHFELEAVTNSNGGINHSGSDRFESNASSTSVWS